MSKKRALIVAGFVIAILPFTGFPREFREALSVLLGLSIIALAFLINRKTREAAPAVEHDTFSQNGAALDAIHPGENHPVAS